MRPLQTPGLAQEPRGEAAREVVSQFCLGQGGALVLYSTTPGFSILVMSMSCAAAERASSRAPRSGRAIMSITWAAFCNPREYLKAVDLRLIFCAQVRVARKFPRRRAVLRASRRSSKVVPTRWCGAFDSCAARGTRVGDARGQGRGERSRRWRGGGRHAVEPTSHRWAALDRTP